MEILEVLPPNCGRDAAPLFLRRQKLPKNLEALRLPGEVCDRTILNVFGSLGPSGRYIVDNLKVWVYFWYNNFLLLGKDTNWLVFVWRWEKWKSSSTATRTSASGNGWTCTAANSCSAKWTSSRASTTARNTASVRCLWGSRVRLLRSER